MLPDGVKVEERKWHKSAVGFVPFGLYKVTLWVVGSADHNLLGAGACDFHVYARS